MSGAKWVVITLGALGEATQAAILTQCANTLFAVSQNFVRVTLVSNIPDQPIFGRVEDMVERNGEFNNT